MNNTSDEYQGLPDDKILLAGLAFSAFGLTNVLTIIGWLLKRRSEMSLLFLGLILGLISIIPIYGLAAGSIRRRSLIGATIVLSWLLFFQDGNISLVSGPGLLACVGIVTYDGVREGRISIGVHFVQSGAVMVLLMVTVLTWVYFQGALPWWGVWVLWKWSSIILLVGGLGLWVIGLTYDSPYLDVTNRI